MKERRRQGKRACGDRRAGRPNVSWERFHEINRNRDVALDFDLSYCKT